MGAMADAIVHESTTTYPAKVITVDWTPIAIGVLGLILFVVVAGLLWRGRKRRRTSKNNL
jgi:hypothetical protein